MRPGIHKFAAHRVVTVQLFLVCAFLQVKQELIQRQLSSRMHIEEKKSRSDDICRKKAEALQRSRNLAARGAELRQALK